MTFKKIVPLIVIITFLLAACGQSAEDSIHNQLEEVVALEDDFRAQQSGIVDLEKREQEIYQEIILLGKDEMKQIIELSEEALTTISQREEKIGIEKESIELSREAFQSIESDFNDLEEDVQPVAEEMYAVMNERYQAYDDLYDAYLASLNAEKELYTVLQEEELEQETLHEQIELVNESYELILTANEQFNTHTTEYNELRKDFYEAANINVSIEDESEAA